MCPQIYVNFDRYIPMNAGTPAQIYLNIDEYVSISPSRVAQKADDDLASFVEGHPNAIKSYFATGLGA
jgi:hypothetical protein